MNVAPCTICCRPSATARVINGKRFCDLCCETHAVDCYGNAYPIGDGCRDYKEIKALLELRRNISASNDADSPHIVGE